MCIHVPEVVKKGRKGGKLRGRKERNFKEGRKLRGRKEGREET